MKTIFLSMLTIAALASCTRQDFIDPNGGGTDPGGEGNEMVVELTISGTPLTTKAGGAATQANDKVINDITVFGVKTSTNSVVAKQFFSTTNGNLQDVDPEAGTKSVAFTTTDQTDAIYVIANIGKDLTGVTGELNLSTVKTLNGATATILKVDGGAKQTEGDVLMSGYTNTINIEGGSIVEKKATASVQLNFIASKVILQEMTREGGTKGDYGTNFKFVGAMLTNVQQNAYYFAGDYTSQPLINPSYIGEITTPGVERLAITKSFISGDKADGEGKSSVFYQDLTSVLAFDNQNKIENVAYWYVFENDEALTGKPTALQIHYQWLETVGSPMVDRYLPVIFGNGNIPALMPGKAYSVKLAINANFLPKEQGGDGPGGDTPEDPTIEGEIGVTVTPADWGNPEDVQKPFP